MARLPFPDAASRWAVDTAGHPIAGHSYTVYTDVTGLHLADIVADVNGAPGAAIAGSVVTTDVFGYLPLWWGPVDGSARLYISDGTISPWPVDAINRYRIDGIDTRVTTLETSPGLTAPVQSVAGRIGAVTLAAADVSGVETPAGAQAKANAVASAAAQALADHTGASVNVHGIADTAALETQTGAQAKATAAQVAAIAASDPVGMAAATVNVHNAATTAVHGINDTSVLETQAGAQSKADAAAAASIPLVQRAAPLGVATLGPDGKLSGAQTPAGSAANYLGPTNNQAEMLALTGGPRDFTIRLDVSTLWVLTGGDPTVLANWTELAYPTAPVLSVNGRTGSVTVTSSDVGLGNVSNTTDATRNSAVATLSNKLIDGGAF